MIGQILGHYRLLEEVGSGGMGVVYRARDERLERDVAVKVLPKDQLDATSRRHLRREALALSRVVHPNIATVHDFDTENDTDFLVMEFIPGDTLADRIAAGPLPPADVVSLGIQLATGLEAAHAHQVVHCDLKPSNLKLLSDGRLKILDFGIARSRQPLADTKATETGPRQPVGTLPYMSPEQLNNGTVDARSDIYATGAVLYEMATGERAFPDRIEPRLINAILNDAPTSPRLLRPSLSRPLESCILKALEKDPARRYQSAADLRADLERIATSAVPDQSRTGSRRQRVGIAVAVGLMAILGLGWVVARGWRVDQPEASPAASPAVASPIRLGVLPPRNLTRRPAIDGWPALIQALFSGELTGVQNLGVMDPISFNAQLTPVLGPGGEPGVGLLDAVRKAGMSLVLDTRIVPAEQGLQLQTSLIDASNGQARFLTRATVSEDRDLPRAVRALAADIVTYLQLEVFGLPQDRDLRPWVSFRERNVEALKAFAQANQYMYRYQLTEVDTYLRRAIALDPAFVAPRIWHISGLLSKGRRAEAETQYRELQTLESTASPFDQTMIGFVGATLKGDRAAEIRYLELALTYSPGNNILLINLASSRAITGDCAGALTDLVGPVQAKWEFPLLYVIWGLCAIRENRVDDARRVLVDSLDLPATDPLVYAILEALELAIGSQADAARYADGYAARLRELKSTPPAMQLIDLYDRLGQYCQAKGLTDRAATLAKKANRLRGTSRPPTRPQGGSHVQSPQAPAQGPETRHAR